MSLQTGHRDGRNEDGLDAGETGSDFMLFPISLVERTLLVLASPKTEHVIGIEFEGLTVASVFVISVDSFVSVLCVAMCASNLETDMKTRLQELHCRGHV